MDIDNGKVDEITLALLYLTTFKDKTGLRAWKSHSWDVLDRLHESGYIHDPATKAKSVILTEEGAERSKRLFKKHFTRGQEHLHPSLVRRERCQDWGFWCNRLITPIDL
jgi:Domain of unknown function (DUF6429)